MKKIISISLLLVLCLPMQMHSNLFYRQPDVKKVSQADLVAQKKELENKQAQLTRQQEEIRRELIRLKHDMTTHEEWLADLDRKYTSFLNPDLTTEEIERSKRIAASISDENQAVSGRFDRARAQEEKYQAEKNEDIFDRYKRVSSVAREY